MRSSRLRPGGRRVGEPLLRTAMMRWIPVVIVELEFVEFEAFRGGGEDDDDDTRLPAAAAPLLCAPWLVSLVLGLVGSLLSLLLVVPSWGWLVLVMVLPSLKKSVVFQFDGDTSAMILESPKPSLLAPLVGGVTLLYVSTLCFCFCFCLCEALVVDGGGEYDGGDDDDDDDVLFGDGDGDVFFFGLLDIISSIGISSSEAYIMESSRSLRIE